MIHESTTARGAGFVRAWVFGLWAIYMLGDAPNQMAVFPREDLDIIGILRLLPDSFYDVVFTNAGLVVLKWVLVALLGACALGVRPWRSIAIPTVLLLTMHQGLKRGLFDYVNHKELSALYVTYVFAVFPATGFSPFVSTSADKAKAVLSAAHSRLVMVLSTAMLLLPYSFIAVRRISHNDWEFWSSDLLSFYVGRNSFSETWYGLGGVGQMVLRHPWLMRLFEVGFPVVSVVELLAPLCLLHRRFRNVWIVVVIGFHVSTLLLMDIFFWESMLLFPVLLVDGDRMLGWFDRLKSKFAPGAASTELSMSQGHRQLASGRRS
jgi:hypothetical protein